MHELSRTHDKGLQKVYGVALVWCKVCVAVHGEEVVSTDIGQAEEDYLHFSLGAVLASKHLCRYLLAVGSVDGLNHCHKKLNNYNVVVISSYHLINLFDYQQRNFICAQRNLSSCRQDPLGDSIY